MALGSWGGGRRRKGGKGGWGRGGAGGRPPLSLPHMSFDVIQAEGYAFVRAASFGLLLALRSSAQLVLNDLGRRWGGGVGGLEPCPSHGPAPSTASAYLVGVVKELQHREDAGPDEQPHLAPNVTCRGDKGRSPGSGHQESCRAHWDRDRQVLFAKGSTVFIQKEREAILVGFLFSLCVSAFFYFSKMNKYYSEKKNCLQNTPTLLFSGQIFKGF